MNSDSTSMHSLQPRWLLAGIPAISMLVMHAYMGSFSRWMADDYCSGADAQRFGVLRAAWHCFRTWNGRYSADLLDAFFGYLGPAVTPVVTLIVLLTWLAALTAAVHSVRRRTSHANPDILSSMCVATIILSLALVLAPNVAQSLYWGQGMRSVVPPLITITLYVALLAWSGKWEWSLPSLVLLAAVSFLLVYIAGGFSETFTAFQLAAFSLTAIASVCRRKRWKSRAEWVELVTGGVAAALAFVTVVASPGNAARQALWPEPPPIPMLLHISIDAFCMFLVALFQSRIKVLALSAALVLGIQLGHMLRIGRQRWWMGLIMLATGGALLFSCFPPAAYGTSEPPFDRTLVIPVYILVIVAVLLGVFLSNVLIPGSTARPVISGVLTALITVTAVIQISQLASARPTYHAYAKAWSQFDAQMRGYQKAGIPSAQIPTADLNANNWACLNVLGDNPEFWVNQCVSDYYHVQVLSGDP